MEYKLIKKSETILISDTLLGVSLYPSVLDSIDWSWDSLMLPTNKATIAIISNENSNDDEFLMLSTSGYISIKDIKEDRYLEIDEVEDLAYSGKLYNEYFDEKPRYDIKSSNYFCVLFYRNYNLLDKYEFKETPRNIEELQDILVGYYLNYFKK